MRYRYVNRLYRAHGAPHGVQCDPVRRPDGRCIVGPRHALVRFEDGTEAVVIRRCLRVNRGEYVTREQRRVIMRWYKQRPKGDFRYIP